MPKFKYYAKCSQCGKKFGADTRGELLDKLRKHIWRNHADWMKKRIKTGLKKRKDKVTNNPAWTQAILAGIFPAANIPSLVSQYKSMSPTERTTAKTLVTALTGTVGGEASAIAKAVMTAFDIASGS